MKCVYKVQRWKTNKNNTLLDQFYNPIEKS